MTPWQLWELLDKSGVLRSMAEHRRMHEALRQGIEQREYQSEDDVVMCVYAYLERTLPDPGVQIVVGADAVMGAIHVELSLTSEGHVARIFGDAYALRS